MPTDVPFDQDRVFERLELCTKSSLELLRRPFKEAASLVDMDLSFDRERFFNAFFTFADRFADQCCSEIAGIIRANTALDTTKGMTAKGLAKDIRSEIFDELDQVLATYANAVASVDRRFESKIQAASERSVTTGVFRGAVTGRMIGGIGGSGDFMARTGGIIGGLSEMAAQQQLVQSAEEILTSAVSIAWQKVDEYLAKVARALTTLIDEASTRCWGARVDLVAQGDVMSRVAFSAKEEMAAARQELEYFVKKLCERDERNVAQEISLSVVRARQKKAKWMIVGGLFLVLIAAISLSSEEDPWMSFLWIAIGISLIVFGCIRFGEREQRLSATTRKKLVASGQGSTGNVIAALCSFLIPGLGQLLQGRILMAIVQFCLAVVLWFVLLGWLVHLWSVVDAALYKSRS